MTQEHPITPPPELVIEWWNQYTVTSDNLITQFATRAARWGADQELEACCEWLVVNSWKTLDSRLRTARRPKPPSLKEHALNELRQISINPEAGVGPTALDTIRRALEQLDD